MIKTAIAAYKAANNMRKFIITIAALAVVISSLFAAKTLWIANHDKTVIEQHDAVINQQIQNKVKTDEDSLKKYIGTVQRGGATHFLDRVLPEAQKDQNLSGQQPPGQIYSEKPNANSNGTQLQRDSTNSGNGAFLELRDSQILGDDIAEYVQAHYAAIKDKETCYAQEILDPEGQGTGTFIETCTKNTKKGGGGYEPDP